MRRNKVWKAQADDRVKKLAGVVHPLRDNCASVRDIAVALNEAKVATARGGPWHPNTVRRLLDRLAT